MIVGSWRRTNTWTRTRTRIQRRILRRGTRLSRLPPLNSAAVVVHPPMTDRDGWTHGGQHRLAGRAAESKLRPTRPNSKNPKTPPATNLQGLSALCSLLQKARSLAEHCVDERWHHLAPLFRFRRLSRERRVAATMFRFPLFEEAYVDLRLTCIL